ncbi:hypothetical protein HMI55_007387 [Coelomomyces lativittatus]|nr:hypothetical protein HMI56_003055 [Coelomomyces lativittatus]KAJ1509411.1 hypothetical protein HMI55_007387 [Coelomomyces lativittatus]
MHLKKDDRLSSTSWTAWWKPFRRTLRSFPKIFWLMQVSLVLLYGTIVPFNTIHSAFLKSKWYPDQPELAAQVMGIPDTISALLVPVVGYFFDRFGQRGYALLLCAVLIALSHLMLGILPNTLLSSPILPLIFLGTAYALILTFIPTIPLVVQENALGAAYGLSNSFSNLSWAIFPILVASLITHDSTYFSTELFFSFCALLAIGVSIHILQLDKRIHHQVLQRPSNSLTNPRPRHETSSEIGLVPLRSHSPSGITGPATRLNKSKEKSEVD